MSKPNARFLTNEVLKETAFDLDNKTYDIDIRFCEQKEPTEIIVSGNVYDVYKNATNKTTKWFEKIQKKYGTEKAIGKLLDKLKD